MTTLTELIACSELCSQGPGRGVSGPDIPYSVEHDPRAEPVDPDRELPHAVHAPPYRMLALDGADDEQEAASPCAGHLRARRSCGQGPFDGGVDGLVGDTRCQAALCLPTLAQRLADGIEVTAAELVHGLACKIAQVVELWQGRGDVCALLAQDNVCAPRDARVEEHDLLLQRPALEVVELDFPGVHVLSGPEPNDTDTTERSDVLVLLADPLAAPLDLDLACPLCQLLGR